jgi:hypothetical protein
MNFLLGAVTSAGWRPVRHPPPARAIAATVVQEAPTRNINPRVAQRLGPSRLPRGDRVRNGGDDVPLLPTMKSRRAFRPACRDKVVGWYPAVALPHRAPASGSSWARSWNRWSRPQRGDGGGVRSRDPLVTDRRCGSRDSRARELSPTNRYLQQPKQGNAEVSHATPTYGGWSRKFRVTRMGEE